MSHGEISQAQRQKRHTLKRAIRGDGDAVDAVVSGVYGAEYVRHEMPAPVDTDSEVLVPLYDVDLNFQGGRYTIDLLVFFRLDGAGAIAGDFGVLQFFLDGDPVSIEYRRTRTANPLDEFEVFTFDDVDLAPGLHNFEIQGRVDTEADELLTVDIFRIRAVRVPSE